MVKLHTVIGTVNVSVVQFALTYGLHESLRTVIVEKESYIRPKTPNSLPYHYEWYLYHMAIPQCVSAIATFKYLMTHAYSKLFCDIISASIHMYE